MKNKLRRALVLGLTVVMTVSMCACGKKDGNGGGLFGGGSKTETTSSDPMLAKQNVYRGEEVALQGIDSDTNIMASVVKDDKLILLLSRYEWDEETYESTQYISLYTSNRDGSNAKTVALEMPEAVPSEDAGDPAFDAYNYSEYYGSYVMTSNGNIYGVKYHYDNWSSEENWKSVTQYNLCCWNSEGKLLQDEKLEGIYSDDDHWCYVDRIIEAENNSLTMIVNSEETTAYSVSADCKITGKVKISDDVMNALSNSETSVVLSNGNLFVMYHDTEDYSKTYYGEVDTKNMTLSGKNELPSGILNQWDYGVMACGLNSELIYSTSNGLYKYKPGDAEATKMMDYVNSDIYVSNFVQLTALTEDSFFAVYRESWEEEGLKAAVFTYVKPEDIPDKTVIVLAGNGLYYEIKKRVIDFNKSSQTTKIVLKDYSEYATYDDYNAGITKLNNDIVTGGMPDILYVDDYSGLPVENYIAKGLIADVGKLIESDPELSQVEFMTNVFDAYSVDGKLYYVVPNFEVYTMLAKKSLVGDRTTWTMKDMQEVLAKMDSDATAFGSDMTRDTFMNMVLRFCGSEFVNFSTGECSFNSQDFIDMLKYAKNFPKEIDYDDDYWMNYDWQAEQAKYREEKTLLYGANLYYFAYFSEIFNGYFGEPVSYVGFPTESGNGSYIMTSGTYVLSSKSANLQEAWDFVKYYLSKDYQEEVGYFPVRKDVFLEKSKQAMERPFWTDDNGNVEYYDNTFYLNGEEIVLDPLTQAQLDEVITFIESVNTRYYSNTDIQNIITEEAEAFFAGQKSAEDVAAIIQSRVQLFVDESR